ncbi:hypothetical protein [Actinoplanes sp. NPDC051859]|uniref:hypothetical protein n=1 Tax=Actinoplanes sp. NPDC051859 TaxID=3363909 RepID=UPI0037B321E2
MTRTRERLTWLCALIAAAGLPATVAVAVTGTTGAAAAGVTAVGGITVAALAAARSLLGHDPTDAETLEGVPGRRSDLDSRQGQQPPAAPPPDKSRHTGTR